MHPRFRRFGIFALACLLSACAGNSRSSGSFQPQGQTGRDPASSGSATSTPVATGPAAVRRSILGQYRRFHQVLEGALATNNTAEISQVAGGAMEKKLRKIVSGQQRDGVVKREHSVLNPRVSSMTPDGQNALVLDCMYTTDVSTFSVKTGKRIGPVPTPHTMKYEAFMKLIDGVWKVDQTLVPKDSRC